MEKFITIDGRKIGKQYPPYIIAELSANHNGDIQRAYKIMEEAKKAGADAIKLQSYTHETITIDSNDDGFLIHKGLWKGKSLYELYKEAHMPWEWHKPLFEKAKALDITIFSSPFDFSSVELLESLNTPAYKIASFELVDLPLIAMVAKTGKPIIMSTGMATKEEIDEAVETARSNGCNDLVVLHCVSGYPAPPEEYNLRTLVDIESSFDVIYGLSDHTLDNTTSLTAVSLGASVVEKHVTLDRNGGGADDSFSLEPDELHALCRDSVVAWKALGMASYLRQKSEEESSTFRRSLYVVNDIKQGEIFSERNIRSIRPGYGLKPKYYNRVLGKRATRDLARGTPLSSELIADFTI